MPVPRRYWSIGVIAALLVHVGIAVAMFWQPSDSGARGAGLGGIEVSLGPSGGAPGTVAVQAAETAEKVEPVETKPTTKPPRQATEPPPESVTARPVESADEPDAAAAEPRPVESQQVAEAPEAAAERVPETVKAAPKPEQPAIQSAPEVAEAEPQEEAAKVAEAQPPEPAHEPVETREAAEPEPAKAATRPEETASEVPPDEVEVSNAAPSAAGSQGKAGTRDEQDAGSGRAASGGGVPGASADYMAALQAWLEKHKRYPRRAQRLRQEGTALLYFVMDRQGRVLEYSIRESSGHDLLDEEVVAMIERAQPLPKMPDNMEQGRLELVVPVQFFLM